MEVADIIWINYRVIHESQGFEAREVCLGKGDNTSDVIKTEVQFQETRSSQVSDGLN